MTNLEDRAAIIDLTARYCWALDSRNWEGLREVFLPDATAELGDGIEHGVDEIIERISGVLVPLDASQHLVANHLVTVDGDRLYLVAGGYEDELVRTPGGWRIAHRRLVVVWTEGNPGVVRGDR